ncbi:MAG: helix-turn-helix domain-containing protein [Desulfurococcales archaeon]|nr:helix-turn-helix domain-containing protein [Desulfurococcales archaeon]
MNEVRGVKSIIEYESCALKDLLSIPLSGKNKRPRIFILRVDSWDNRLHVWLRIVGSKSQVREVLRRISGTSNTYYTIIGNTCGGTIVYVTMPAKGCNKRIFCPLATPSPRMYPISTIIENGRMKSLVIAAYKKDLEILSKHGFRLRIIDYSENSELALTERQEQILLKAFLNGYYSYPRRIDLKAIAEKVNLSLSTVAELLRKAEIKLVKRYLLEELFIAYDSNSMGLTSQQPKGRELSKKHGSS